MKTAGDILAQKERKLISVQANQTIAEALTLMNENRVGSILVTGDDGMIIGIWTERDLIQDVLQDGFDVRTAIIGDYMTKDLHSAKTDATIQELKEMMLSLFIRHILIKEDGAYVGLLSVGDTVRASLIAQDKHIQELKAHTSWRYYESWGWTP